MGIDNIDTGLVCAAVRTNLSYYFIIGNSVGEIGLYAERILGSAKTGLEEPVKLDMSTHAVLDSLCSVLPEKTSSIRFAVENYRGKPKTLVNCSRIGMRFSEPHLRRGLLVGNKN